MTNGVKMTKVDFYLLAGQGQDAREAMACKLIEKIYRLNHKIYIHTESDQDSSRIDNLLWTLNPGNFIPHEIANSANHAETPVIIGHDPQAPQIHDVLVNLTHEVPLFFSQFNRVAELVDADETHKNLGRTRFKFYKDRGYELDTHDIAY